MSNEQQTADQRTSLQREANAIDCDLYRLIGRVERLWDENKNARKLLSDSLNGLRGARVGLRTLMHKQDRAETI